MYEEKFTISADIHVDEKSNLSPTRNPGTATEVIEMQCIVVTGLDCVVAVGVSARDDHVVAHDDGRVLGPGRGVNATFVQNDPGGGVETVHENSGGRFGKPGIDSNVNIKVFLSDRLIIISCDSQTLRGGNRISCQCH